MRPLNTWLSGVGTKNTNALGITRRLAWVTRGRPSEGMLLGLLLAAPDYTVHNTCSYVCASFGFMVGVVSL